MKAILFDFGGTIDTDGVHWSEKYWDLYEQFSVGVAASVIFTTKPSSLPL